MFIFAYANGTLEAVANPLVATFFPENRTPPSQHPARILACMVLGSVVYFRFLTTRCRLAGTPARPLSRVPWCLYAIMFLGQKFPKSEAAEKAPASSKCSPVGILGAVVACYLLAWLFFGDISTALSPEYGGHLHGIGGLLLIAGGHHKFSFGSLSVCPLVTALRARNSALMAGSKTSPEISSLPNRASIFI
ncbi:MAG: hypothetical protein R3F13_02240 [Prosthecobacter sp.]